jgi:hypothetical protein
MERPPGSEADLTPVDFSVSFSILDIAGTPAAEPGWPAAEHVSISLKENIDGKPLMVKLQHVTTTRDALIQAHSFDRYTHTHCRRITSHNPV